ncbi:MAG: 1-deoxy-D-xylulose-5-phosphate reductoisomerase [Clostridia bacterium]|nr:1-deoxy-D-xylulose-5-phosphate reductoisomerase [Clostridia bacterium]
MKKLSILGSTGSIGTQALEVIRTHRAQFNIKALTAGRNIQLFKQQLKEFAPEYAVVELQDDAMELSKSFPEIEFSYGMEGLCTAAAHTDSEMVLNGLLGMLGLRPTAEAISAGKDIAFANKETLVAGGELIMSAVAEKGVAFIPVDSEHSAIFQCMQKNPVRKLILTASGGPFRGYTKEQLDDVTLEQALKHPNWAMGAKITIDSATMMNKGLEVIEAKWLFGVRPEDIDVIVHPESLLHSAVEFCDGSVIGQLGLPDMKIPIAYALSYPERMINVGQPLDLTLMGSMHFEKPDIKTFRCLALAYDAIKAGQSYAAVLNAANEEAVAAFLQYKIKFVEIPEIVERALDSHQSCKIKSIDDIFSIEKETRLFVSELIKGL